MLMAAAGQYSRPHARAFSAHRREGRRPDPTLNFIRIISDLCSTITSPVALLAGSPQTRRLQLPPLYTVQGQAKAEGLVLQSDSSVADLGETRAGSATVGEQEFREADQAIDAIALVARVCMTP
jgi:hypothetical protein